MQEACKPRLTIGGVSPSSAQAPSCPANPTLPTLLIQRALLGNDEAKHECLKLTGMAEPQWEVCMNSPIQSVLLSQLLSDPQSKDLLGVPVIQSVVGQFGMSQSTMSESDTEVPHIKWSKH